MKFFITVIFALLTTTASAQTIPVVEQVNSAKASPSQQFTAADTVRALHNLFKSRRITGGLLAGGSAAVITIAGVGTAAEGNSRNCGDGYFCPDAAGAVLIFTVTLAPAWLSGLTLIGRFSTRKEHLVIKEYENSGHLPRKYQKRLAVRFLNPNYRFGKSSKQ